MILEFREMALNETAYFFIRKEKGRLYKPHTKAQTAWYGVSAFHAGQIGHSRGMAPGHMEAPTMHE